MKQLTITNGFTKMSDPVLSNRAQQIHDHLKDNVNFADPQPTLTELKDAIDVFCAALLKCKDADRLNLAIKNQKREILIDTLHLLGDYVLFKSAGNRVAALSSGFSIKKTRAPRPPLTKPESYAVENGSNPCELKSISSTVPVAISYNHQYIEAELLHTGIWQTVPSTRAHCIIRHLKSGVIYHCRVEVLGSHGQVMYSDIQTRRVA
jgi:hypothetical protein